MSRRRRIAIEMLGIARQVLTVSAETVMQAAQMMARQRDRRAAQRRAAKRRAAARVGAIFAWHQGEPETEEGQP